MRTFAAEGLLNLAFGTSNSPFNHAAIRLARMVDEACDGATSGINDHLIMEGHQIVTLYFRQKTSCKCESFATNLTGRNYHGWDTYLVVFILLIHPPIT